MILGPDRNPLSVPAGKLRLPLDEAVARAAPGFTPMAIPAPDVLAVDFDEPDNPQQVRRLDVLKDELAAAGYVPVITASGRPGHQHLWCLIEDVDDRERLFRVAEALKLSLRRGRPIRLPLAPHAEGLPVHLVSPETRDAALRAVRRTAPAPALPPPAPPVASTGLRLVKAGRAVRPLGTRQAKALRDGALAAGYDTRHGADLGIALSAIQAGWTFNQLREEYDNPSNTGGERYRHSPPPVGGVDYLRRTWEAAAARAEARPATTDPHAVAELLSRWQLDALGQPWPGRSGATDLALYTAMVSAALAASPATLTPAVSRQEMADSIAVWPSVAEQALSRLLTRKCIVEHEKGDIRSRTRWRILPPPSGGEAGVLGSPLGRTENEYTVLALSPGHDAFTSGGLGLTGWQLLSVLNPLDPLTPGALSARTGRDIKTTRRYVRRFCDLGLAEPSGDGYCRAPVPDLDAAAESLRVTGAAGARAAVGAAKRAAWVAMRDNRDAAVAKLVSFDPDTGEVLHRTGDDAQHRQRGNTY